MSLVKPQRTLETSAAGDRAGLVKQLFLISVSVHLYLVVLLPIRPTSVPDVEHICIQLDSKP